jgi:hypothetical protein
MQALNPQNKLTSLRVDNAGNLLTAGAAPVGGATESTLQDVNTSVQEVNSAITSLETMVNSGSKEATLLLLLAKFPTLLNDRVKVEPLGSAGGIARQLAAASASANVALTSTCRRVSLFARGADIRYSIGSSAQTATTTSGVATSHYLAQGERIELVVPATPNIAAIRAGTTDGTLEITELL